MHYNIPVKKENYNIAVLKAINCFLKLSKFQIDIIDIILKDDNKVLTTLLREQIRKETGKGINSTNNYIKILKDKKVLIETEQGLILNNSILNVIKDKEITIRFSIN